MASLELDPTKRPDFISFDCYGTLIYFEITSTTLELIGDQLDDEQIARFLPRFSKYRYDEVCGDYRPYAEVLHNAYARTCRAFGVDVAPDAGERLAAAVLTWGPHADVPAPLATMGANYPLVILSNADTSFLDVSVPKLGAPFHAVYTAEQAQAYKPRYQAFEYMLEQLGTTPDRILHVSSHTRYDLMPADDLGFTNKVFLDRGYDPQSPAYRYVTVGSLDELNRQLGL
ncbi:haloacid dehalogenase type II [Williamsia sp. CHRR-6]|uniref:haloacid dehalogenase type II n=1 Tax=Williamsia sp. CHRR-6 TaxID=2835871 RepID=UPI001BDABA5C|nr:haloacid dehalogenase type II [Williamsia sp. CHRR-6]MBT0566808.1 haloacid dehalogenase type II [Williamsia sp. CHRR-6]